MTINFKTILSNIAFIAILACNNSEVFSQANFPNILYGAAYYHEYMPYERLDKDIQMMKDAGISVVRLGESTWSLWEPRKAISNLPGWTGLSTDSSGQY